MKNPKKQPSSSWWEFIDESETFRAAAPDRISRLYFPLCNEAGLMSAITPQLHGDIKTGLNSFLTLPVSTEDLHTTRSARNFWVVVDGRDPWSVVGTERDKCRVEAGALWHQMTCESKSAGLKMQVVNFVPIPQDRLEVRVVKGTNITRNRFCIRPTAATP